MKRKIGVFQPKSWLISYLNLCLFVHSAKPALTPHKYMPISSPSKIVGKSSLSPTRHTSSSTYMNYNLERKIPTSPDQVACTRSWYSSERSRTSSGGSSSDHTSLTFDDHEKLDAMQLHTPSPEFQEWDHSINLSDPLKSKALKSKQDDLPGPKDIQARITLLTQTAHHIEGLLKSVEEEHITIKKAEELRNEIVSYQIILQSSLYELSHFQNKIHSYMTELLKSQADFEDSLASKTNLVPGFVEGLGRLETQLKQSSMMRYIATQRGESGWVKSWLEDLGNQDQPKIISLQSLNKLSQEHFLPKFSLFSNQAFVVSIYEELLSGFELSFAEEKLIENFKNKASLSTSDYELFNECVIRFLIHQLSHNELQRKIDVWSKLISKIELSIDEEMTMYILEKTHLTQPISLTQNQNLQSLKVRKAIFALMKRYLKALEDIDHRLDYVRQLSKDEQEFLKKHFEIELIAMRKMLESFEMWDQSPTELQAEMRFQPQARQHQIQIGIHSDLNTDLSVARDFIKHIESDLSKLKPKIKMQLFAPFLSEIRSASYIMSSLDKPHLPLTVIQIMKAKGVKEINELFSYMVINKQLQVLEEKLRLIGTDDHNNCKPEERVMLMIQELNDLEKKRLIALQPDERGQAMLELIKRCDIKPISSNEDSLLEKLKARDILEGDEVHHLSILADQYQKAIISTISENDLALSHFLWLEDKGTLSETHELQDLFLRDPFLAQEVKFTLQRIAFSPMEKLILFRITEKYMEESLENIVLNELQNKLVITGSLSHYENKIKNQLEMPNWRQERDSDDKFKVMNQIYRDHLHSKAINKDENTLYLRIIQGGRISNKMDKMDLGFGEMDELKALQFKIQNNIDNQISERQIKTILKKVKQRSDVIQDLQVLRHKLSFNRIKMKELALNFDKLMREFQSHKEAEESRISYLYKKYLRAKNRFSMESSKNGSISLLSFSCHLQT
ncbi:uncharacterized protein MELLADRAFT_64977 [Melampsora larici-populina 98AG31]|uniref:Uncharacterized protein n=1 Tax=Melampsora larici-populina (strain 98AG31 / pathotype 3-4-7) TaxID=747676 RepID=F4RTH7_MELLP|nr:uncharacterized protein MELLADRAFT_64977 [Melampsora larici-populina 98AG31]EGG04334.1 hypothetical protein MELLADRAFT_64977 [Melampsora larici-populina 98AG31]